MNAEIKKADMNDFENIFSLLDYLFGSRGHNINKQITKKICSEQMKKGDEALGLITLSIKLDVEDQGYYGQIDELAVLEKYQGKKIGKKLILALKKEARKKKCKTLMLYSSFMRRKAHKFYRKLGFKNTAYVFWRNVR